jgi:uncharacterized protein with PQ loop repeat
VQRQRDGCLSRAGAARQEMPMITELIGWAAATVLLATIGRQVYSQWRSRSSQGASKWLFVGQITASIGFVVYSWLLGKLGIRRHECADAVHGAVGSMDLYQ